MWATTEWERRHAERGRRDTEGERRDAERERRDTERERRDAEWEHRDEALDFCGVPVGTKLSFSPGASRRLTAGETYTMGSGNADTESKCPLGRWAEEWKGNVQGRERCDRGAVQL